MAAIYGEKVRGERHNVLVEDHVGGNQPLSFRVHRQGQALQGVGPQQGRGLLHSEDHAGDYALAVNRSPRLSVLHLDAPPVRHQKSALACRLDAQLPQKVRGATW